MSRTCTTVPLRADELYKQALRALADQLGIDMGDLVREAIDEKFGADMKPYSDFFVAQTERKNVQLNLKK